MKIVIDYAISFLDYASSPTWSANWDMQVSGGTANYKARTMISRDASDTAIAAKVESGSSTYTSAVLNGVAYYGFDGIKRSYDGEKGGRQLFADIFPIEALSEKQKTILRAAWLVVPFESDIIFGTNAGGQINEYAATVDLSKLLVNLDSFSTTGSNSEAAGAINKINAMLLKLVNMAFDKELTQINSETVELLPEMTADIHIVTSTSGNTEVLKEIYFKPTIGGVEKNLFRIYKIALSNRSGDYDAKSLIGSTSGYTETDDAGYTALFDSIQNAQLKEKFKFISDYLDEIKAMFQA